MRIIEAGYPQKSHTFLQEWWGNIYWECVACQCVFIPSQDDHVTVNSLCEEYNMETQQRTTLLQACATCPNCGHDLGISVPYEPV